VDLLFQPDQRQCRPLRVQEAATMVLLKAPADGSGRRGVVERGDYLIDRFRVRFEFGGGWKCACADFVASDACRHTREAAGRRAAQVAIADHIREGRTAGLSAPRRALSSINGTKPRERRATPPIPPRGRLTAL
jgi:hypothetical protein